MDRAICIPAKIYGTEAGSTILVKIWLSRAPSILAQPTSVVSTLRAPSKALITTLQKAAMKMMNHLGISPRPNHRMARDVHAMGGMGRMMLNSGMKIAFTLGYQPISRPRVMPTTQAAL